MVFEYNWENNEANFGPQIKNEVAGGTHISFENILKFNGKYVALRRPEAIPEHEIPEKAQKSGKQHLYFAHGLPRWGEDLNKYVRRIVKEQANVDVKSFKIVDMSMKVYKDSNQWAFTPYVIVDLKDLPKKGIYGNEITEVVTFTKNNIPDEFGWWTKDELKDFLDKFD